MTKGGQRVGLPPFFFFSFFTELFEPDLSLLDLLFQAPVFSAQAFQLGLIVIDPLLIMIRLRHHLVADQRAGDQSNGSADRRASGRMSYGAADNRPAAGAHEAAEQSPLFPLAQGGGAAGDGDNRKNQHEHEQTFILHRSFLPSRCFYHFIHRLTVFLEMMGHSGVVTAEPGR